MSDSLFGRFDIQAPPRRGNPKFGRLDPAQRVRVLGSYRDDEDNARKLERAAEKLGITPGEYIRRAVRLAFIRDLDHIIPRHVLDPELVPREPER